MKVKGSIVRRGLLAGAMLLTGGSAAALTAAPAGASNTQVTAVGSFTTFFMMHALFPTSLNDINPNPETGAESQSIAADSQTCSGGLTYNTATQPPNGSGAGKTALAGEETAAVTSQGCIDFSRSSSPPAPHNETLPSGDTEHGDPSPSHLDYYAYALDGVDVVVGTNAPVNVWTAGSDTGAGNGLTLTQIRNIYACAPNFTNWGTIEAGTTFGTAGQIVKFWPQSGSGTRAVYTDVLGFDPTHNGVGPDQCTAATLPITGFTLGAAAAPNEENAEDGIIYANSTGVSNTVPATPAGSVAVNAIYVYSAGKMSQQWNDTADYNSHANNFVDQTLNGGTVNTMGNFDAADLNMATVQNTSTNQGQAYVDLTSSGIFNEDTNRGTLAVDGTTVTEANEWYSHQDSTHPGNPTATSAKMPGIRYVYNVADTVLPGYNGTKLMVGFDNQSGGTKSVLCTGADSATISAQGFLPLTTGAAAPANSDTSGATCREFPGLSYPGQGGLPIAWTPVTFDNRSS